MTNEVVSVVRLRDVAERHGVSIATVSLAVNHKDTGRVNQELAESIRSTAEQMGYRPNRNALGLKLNKTHTVALILHTVADDPFLGAMTKGAQEAAWDNGYVLVTIPEYDTPESDAEAIASALRWDVDGIVLATDYLRERPLPTLPEGTPLVLLDCMAPAGAAPVTEVVADEITGAYDATTHLIRSGHTAIGYVGISDDRFPARQLREEGCRQAVREHLGVRAPLHVIDAADPTIRAGEQAGASLFDDDADLTALFCFSDRTAFGVARAAAERGLCVPEDLSLVGFDNVEYTSEFYSPGLTTIELPHRHMASTAVLDLIRQIEHGTGSPSRIEVPCPLIERESVALATERKER